LTDGAYLKLAYISGFGAAMPSALAENLAFDVRREHCMAATTMLAEKPHRLNGRTSVSQQRA
jgi:hypothetical protein